MGLMQKCAFEWCRNMSLSMIELNHQGHQIPNQVVNVEKETASIYTC